MEPTLCFSLCQTPIIYIRNFICRCAWAGLMDHNRQNDDDCKLPCRKLGNRRLKTNNSCGGYKAYSAYIKNHFYIKYIHLFNYQIQLKSCESEENYMNFNIFQVEIDGLSIK
ncbi:unnamed protein product [Adineta ricciae]|uniref:Uncharacterized protein n=1 Tax=Adineta ricciae TaxID=249248 RepID=A0A815WS44_ADIRI|nr:unnamed protein product [Adineta ricciae]CAF1639798.1 unnamed protein product [Adineta ricciae]